MSKYQNAYREGMLRAIKEASESISAELGEDKVAIGEELMQRLGLMEPEPQGMSGGAELATGLGGAAAGGLGGQAMLDYANKMRLAEAQAALAPGARELHREGTALASEFGQNKVKGPKWRAFMEKARSSGIPIPEKGRPDARLSQILREAADAGMGEERASAKGLGKGLSKYLSPSTMSTLGHTLRAGGILGGTALAGKGIYDLIND